MSVALLIIDDGREDYLVRCLASVKESLPVEMMDIVMVSDAEHKLGFSGAVQDGWQQVLDTGAEWVFHLESDFIFNAPVPVDQMTSLLKRHPSLAQVSLKRQAVNDLEIAAGGIVELTPDDYQECSDDEIVWTEHRKFFTTNPSVYLSEICKLGWPQVKHSEGIFSHQLMEDPDLHFAIWGRKFDPPTVTHIGERRAGHGY